MMETTLAQQSINVKSIVSTKTQTLEEQISKQLNEVTGEIESKQAQIVDFEIKVSQFKSEIKELLDFQNRLNRMYSLLTVDNNLEHSVYPIRLGRKVEEGYIQPINSNNSESSAWYDSTREKIEGIGTRFWEDKGFTGWPTFLRNLLERTNSFLSVYDVVRLIDNEDSDVRKRVESAINNAFSTGAKHGRFGGVNFKELGRRFYGLHIFFDDYWPLEKYKEDLRIRMQLENLEVEDVILNSYSHPIKVKVRDVTDRYKQLVGENESNS